MPSIPIRGFDFAIGSCMKVKFDFSTLAPTFASFTNHRYLRVPILRRFNEVPREIAIEHLKDARNHL